MNLPSRTDPFLFELEQAYRGLNHFDHSNWESYQNMVDVEHFRGEHGYLSQLNYGHDAARYARTWEYAVNHGLQDLLACFPEDGAFGAVTFSAPDGTLYSRDSLDSAFEIGFLRDVLGISVASPVDLLDIGAGYGRLLHRWKQAFPAAIGVGVDGVPLSTYLCDYYIKYRQMQHSLTSLPLSQVQHLPVECAEVATNCYSFGEMTYSAIEFWVKLCAELSIRYFLVVPHDYGHTDGAFVSHERDGSNIDYLPIFAKHGYRELRRRHKYQPRESSSQYAWGTEYLLMKRRG